MIGDDEEHSETKFDFAFICRSIICQIEVREENNDNNMERNLHGTNRSELLLEHYCG